MRRIAPFSKICCWSVIWFLDYPLTIGDGHAHVEAVVRVLSTFGQEIRGTINEADELDDAGTADLFTEISRGIDKWLWFVEAHNQATK
jgi:starvation-inducible DNA-binding protein